MWLMRQSDVMSTNLHMLSAIRLGLEQDRVGTSCRFALSAALADQLCGFGQDRLWELVAHVGQSTLFPPRHDLIALLDLPTPLAGALAAVHAPESERRPHVRM